MTDRDAFLTAIAESPGDDVPRLVYADWLDEQGESDRAEFVRLHVRLRQVGPDAAVGRRLEELDAARDAEWFGTPRVRPNKPEPPVPGFGYSLDGGLVDAVRVRAPFDGWLDRLARLIADEPIHTLAIGADGFQFAEYPGLFAAMAGWPQLARVRSLRIWAAVEPEEMTHLGRNPYLSNLQALDLSVPSAAAVEALAAEPLPARLTTLSFRCPGDDSQNGRGALAIATLVNRTRIAELALGGLSERDTMTLLGSVANPHVTALDLKDAGLHDAALPALMQCSLLGQLRSLNLRVNYFSADRLRDLFRSDRLANLTRLRASDCISYNPTAGREVWQAITAAPFAANLTVLDFAYRPGLTADDLWPLLANRMPVLESLALGPAAFGNAGVRQILGSPVAANLRELNLWDCGVTDTGAVGLTRDALPRLERLNVRRNPLSAEARRWLLEQFGPAIRLDGTQA